ncbi:hypothetical protein EDD93_5825 [Streptomyces sp. 840.1]|nr:hypothetical protein EDD93_5825 [Streptomyces sp. 840.1]
MIRCDYRPRTRCAEPLPEPRPAGRTAVPARCGAWRGPHGARLTACGGDGPRRGARRDRRPAGCAGASGHAGRPGLHPGELRHLTAVPRPGTWPRRAGAGRRAGGHARVRPGHHRCPVDGAPGRSGAPLPRRRAQRPSADLVRGRGSAGGRGGGRAPPGLPSRGGLAAGQAVRPGGAGPAPGNRLRLLHRVPPRRVPRALTAPAYLPLRGGRRRRAAVVGVRGRGSGGRRLRGPGRGLRALGPVRRRHHRPGRIGSEPPVPPARSGGLRREVAARAPPRRFSS